jgi:AmmeMemoRadiSam system protein A
MHSPDPQGLPGDVLLQLARGSIEYGVRQGDPLPVRLEELPRAFAEPGATFTTLHLDGQLRGCCGSLQAVHPLATDVTRSAFQAAFRDPRFEPVGECEVAAIRLEVSVLSPMHPISATDEAALLAQLTPGTDGLVLIEGGRRATFLPTVWDSLPDPRRFVAALKTKCGLPVDYWSERIEFQRYRTSSYAESV